MTILSYLRRTKSAQCSFIFCSFTLREFSFSSLGKRLVIKSRSVKAAELLLAVLLKLIFKTGILVSQYEIDSGFSSKIGTIPPKSGRLDTLKGFQVGLEACSP